MDPTTLAERRVSFENSLSLVGTCIVDGDGFEYEHANCTVRFEFNKLDSGKEMCSVEITENKSTTMKDFLSTYDSPYDYKQIQKFIDGNIKRTPTYGGVFGHTGHTRHTGDVAPKHSSNESEQAMVREVNEYGPEALDEVIEEVRATANTRPATPSSPPSGGMGTPANLITDCIQCLAARVGLLESNHF